MGLMEKVSKGTLSHLYGTVRPEELEQIRRNLVTWFSYYTFVDLTPSIRQAAPPEKAPLFEPGMIFAYQKEKICVIDHWGCFNEYPLIYVAPIEPDLPDPSLLDVDISNQFSDLFSASYFVRTGEFFPLERGVLEATHQEPVHQLTFGSLHKVSRCMALKFGQLGLLL